MMIYDTINDIIIKNIVGNKLVITKEIQLYDGDGLQILPESKSFIFECCGCGFKHLIDIEHDPEGIILRFKEVRE